jgi:hypothetical protein
MTEQKIGEAWREYTRQPLEDPAAEAKLAAALLGGEGGRDDGLDLLGRMPQGPQLARVVASLEPDAERLSRDLAQRARPARPLRRIGAVLALAASAAAVAVLVGGLRSDPVAPAATPMSAEAPSAADGQAFDPGSIMVASFEADTSGGQPAHATPIFRSDFDS